VGQRFDQWPASAVGSTRISVCTCRLGLELTPLLAPASGTLAQSLRKRTPASAPAATSSTPTACARHPGAHLARLCSTKKAASWACLPKPLHVYLGSVVYQTPISQRPAVRLSLLGASRRLLTACPAHRTHMHRAECFITAPALNPPTAADGETFFPCTQALQRRARQCNHLRLRWRTPPKRAAPVRGPHVHRRRREQPHR